jgi:hypothetical protein
MVSKSGSAREAPVPFKRERRLSREFFVIAGVGDYSWIRRKVKG